MGHQMKNFKMMVANKKVWESLIYTVCCMMEKLKFQPPNCSNNCCCNMRFSTVMTQNKFCLHPFVFAANNELQILFKRSIIPHTSDCLSMNLAVIEVDICLQIHSGALIFHHLWQSTAERHAKIACVPIYTHLYAVLEHTLHKVCDTQSPCGLWNMQIHSWYPNCWQYDW